MAEINLTQAEADALIAMEKHQIDDKTINWILHKGQPKWTIIPKNLP